MAIIPPDRDPGIFSSTTLANGAVVYYRQSMPAFGLPKIAISTVVTVGGRDDPPGKEGTAHFFEHMPFRGTTLFPNKAALTREVEINGGYINAFTTDEATGYEIVVPASLAEDSISRVAEMLLRPKMLPADIETERLVILEELRNQKARVTFYARRELLKALLGDHPIVHAVIGNEDTLKAVTPADLADFHQRYYQASNLVIFIAGQFKPDQLLELGESYFGSIGKGEKTQRQVKVASRQPAGYQKVLTPPGYNRSLYLLGRVLPPLDLAGSIKIKLFRAMLAGGMNSPLNREIREKRGLAYSLGFHHDRYCDVGLLTLAVATQFKHMDEIDRLFWREAEAILENTARFEEIKKMAKQSALHHEFSLGELVDRAIDSYLDYGRIPSLREIITVIEGITLSDVRKMITPYLVRGEFLNLRVNCDGKRALTATV